MGLINPKKEKAFELRRKGKSYSQIMKELDIPSKGTLSYWFKDLTLDKKSKKLLRKNLHMAQKRGLYEANQRRTIKINKENKSSYKKGFAKIKSLSKRELLLVGVALYWAEGSKFFSRKNASVDFVNSDPRMIKTFMRFIRKILRPEEERIRARIQIHPNIKEEEARKYWSKITSLPEDRFYITKAVSHTSKGKRPKRKLPYGTISVRINNRGLFHNMIGMIEGLAQCKL